MRQSPLRVLVNRVVATVTLSFVTSVAAAPQTVLTDQVLALLLAQHAPAILYEQSNYPWPGGSFRLQVLKNGAPDISSSPLVIAVKLPVKIIIHGVGGNDLLNIHYECHSDFSTIADIVFKPQQLGKANLLRSTIELPIPGVIADCGAIKLPIDEVIRTLVSQQKTQWQKEVDTNVNKWLNPSSTGAKK